MLAGMSGTGMTRAEGVFACVKEKNRGPSRQVLLPIQENEVGEGEMEVGLDRAKIL